VSVRAAIRQLGGVALALLVTASSAFAGSEVVATNAALATASPYATQAGLMVLKHGGNAIDAAVAVSFALAVAHPQAGNIGGGGFLVYYDAKSGAVWTLDFREVAPEAAKRNMFVLPDGSIAPASRTGPLAIGVPGTVAGLEAMHRKFGTRPWKELLQPAIALARDGVATDQQLTDDLTQARKERSIDGLPATAALFYPKHDPLPAGTRFIQPELASTLTRLADFGPRDFYEGNLADGIVAAIQKSGGILSHRDLREYAPVWRAPIRIRFRDVDIYTMAPPGAGGIVIGEALNILSGYDLVSTGFQTPKSIHLIAEAERRACIDRNKYLGDPSTVRIPYRDLLSDSRAAAWRSSIKPDRVTPTTTLAEPGATAVAESSQTTHFTIADAQGNVAAVTTTLDDKFGSGFVVPGFGFFLNDAMDDFSVASGKPNGEGLVQGIANAIEPKKRMASSMSPIIVLKNSKPLLAMGTRGGPRIPTTMLQVLLNFLVYDKPIFDAIAAPRFHQQAEPDQIEYERLLTPNATIEALGAMGHGVSIVAEPIGDVQALMFAGGKITAVADPRGHGAAGGY
jgi:gamma-glutamyltranspeptidase / glutathione hydrolase